MVRDLSNNQLLLKECVTQDFLESDAYCTEDEYFEYFAASQVLKKFNLTDEELDNGIVGGGNDGGCDGLFLFLNDELMTFDQLDSLVALRGSKLDFFIIQAKNTLSFREDVIMKWKTISENLLNISSSEIDYSNRYNEQTLETFSLFNNAVKKLVRFQIKISFHFEYVCLGDEIHPNTLQQAEELKNVVKANYPSANVQVSFIGADELMLLYNTYPEACICLELSEQPISLSNKDYVALVNMGKYYNFIADGNGDLRSEYFESNVRDYQGRNSVNKSIAETLADHTTEDFWWFNNGITVLASEISYISKNTLQLLNPGIVNGLQTSREIYNFYKANPEKLSNEARNVLVRIIEPKDEETRDYIIFATNNQTNIQKSSLRGTDPIHLHIEMYFKRRGLFYDRRKNYYKNLKKRPSDIVSVSFLAQCLISIVLHKPDMARARPSTLLTDDEAYSFLYEQNQNLESYYKAARIGQIVRNNLRKSSEILTSERSDIQFYIIYAVVAKRLGKREISFKDLAEFNVEYLNDFEIDEIKNVVYSKYKTHGGNGQVAKDADFVSVIDEAIGLQRN